VIGAISWVVLVIALVTGVAELISLTGADPPLVIGGALGTALGFAALAAALERALRFKSNRWLD
jgi:NAD/NADP transhydrogenase beta subunit